MKTHVTITAAGDALIREIPDVSFGRPPGRARRWFIPLGGDIQEASIGQIRSVLVDQVRHDDPCACFYSDEAYPFSQVRRLASGIRFLSSAGFYLEVITDVSYVDDLRQEAVAKLTSILDDEDHYRLILGCQGFREIARDGMDDIPVHMLARASSLIRLLNEWGVLTPYDFQA